MSIYDSVNNGYIADINDNSAINFDAIINNVGIFELNIHLENSRCSLDLSDNIYIYPEPTAIISPSDAAGCEIFIVPFIDKSIIPLTNLYALYGEGNAIIDNWEWYFPGTLTPFSPDPLPVIEFDALGSPYVATLVVTTNHKCKDTIQAYIFVDATPVAEFVTPLSEDLPNYGTYIFDGRLSTTSTGDSARTNLYNYEWLIEDGMNWVEILDGNPGGYGPSPNYLLYQYNYVMNYEDSSEICLTVINKTTINTAAACYDSTCKMVLINYLNTLYVPNALYPTDQSSGSREFLPKGKSLEEYHLQIFDKFGNLLWETEELNVIDGSPKNGWRGNTQGGSTLPQGTYIWKIEATFSNGENWKGINNKKTGAVYLIR